MDKTSNIKDYFINAYKNKEFTIDKTGSKTIEMIPASFVCDQNTIFGNVNKEYINAELEWYKSQSTNIKDLPYKIIPAAWKYTANSHGEVNSNYGRLVFSDQYYNQFSKVVDELLENKDTRRACLVYTRPSIWEEFKSNGKNDFICTNAVTYYIRNNKLHCVVQMRSNDVVYGYKNDYAWQEYLLTMISDLVCIEVGNIFWQVQNLHIYERHFEYLEV
jgi:thymidylate synthase|tara:strand:- start:4441 stop:5094 length:654 start_codon:yes stop_codon:yes gene_type:complete